MIRPLDYALLAMREPFAGRGARSPEGVPEGIIESSMRAVVLLPLLMACSYTTTARTDKPQARRELEPERVEVRQPMSAPLVGRHLVVRVSGAGVSLGGEPTSDLFSDLRRAMARDRHETYDVQVTVAADASSQSLAAVLQAIAAAKLGEVELKLGEERAIVRLPSEADIGTALVLDGQAAPAIGRWYLEPRASVEWSPGDEASDSAIEQALKPRCEDVCLVHVWVRASTSVEQLFKALRVVARWQVQSPALQVNVVPTPTPVPDADSGVMPPVVIQAIVRANFLTFRSCYNDGLKRDARLIGSVKARLVIDQQGKVKSVTDDGSDIPDAAVRDCALKAFRQLVFPAPEGGNVTVVYPIVFALDERASVTPK